MRDKVLTSRITTFIHNTIRISWDGYQLIYPEHDRTSLMLDNGSSFLCGLKADVLLEHLSVQVGDHLDYHIRD